LPEIYASAFCGIVASTGWDSFAFGTIEMAAAGLPVIASRLQGLAEAVVDGQTGILFEPGNHLMLADCIERLLDNPELAAEYGRRGRQRCESELSYSHQKRLFLEVLRRRIAQSRGSGS
jgi:glycosyltransferase involved in cell wall biosynthesis